MAVKRDFYCRMATLLYEGNLILTETETQTDFAKKRLRDGLVTETRDLYNSLGGEGSSAQKDKAARGRLTGGQNDAVIVMLDLFGRLKDAARKAFRGQDVILKEDFQVGIKSPNDLGSVLGRAKKARDAAQKPNNAPGLKDIGGWISDDTTELGNTIATVETIDKDQQQSLTVQITGTDERNTAANNFYRNVLTIQGAADNEWPARLPANRGVRESFRLGIFPPSHKGKTAKPQTPQTPTPAVPTPA